jgi:hypothetical protein
MKGWKVVVVVGLLGASGMAGVVGAARAEDGTMADARRILERFSGEPSVVEVQDAAARYARVNPDAYESWMSASRFAYLLPKSLRGQVRSTQDDGRDVRTSSGSISDLISSDEQAQYEVRADWDLTRLVFNRDGVVASRQIERLVNQREDILTTVNKLFFARRQLQVELELDPPSNVEKAIKMQLRVDALTADLDALTGGWFGKKLKAKR